MTRFPSLEVNVESAIQKADTLLEALAWIREFRDKITVIKLGGSVMESEAGIRDVLNDIVFMEAVGMRPVVVHGGGAAISRAMSEAGIEPNFIRGRRFTDEATLAVVEEVLAYQTNESIAGTIESLGGRAMNLNFKSTNVLFGEKITLPGADGPIDLGHVGAVNRVDRSVIENLCYAGQVPVIPSMCLDESGQKLNVNADTAATAVAQALGAEKLVFLSDIQGVLRDPDDPESLIHSMDEQEAMQLIKDEVVVGGMIPKIEACIESLRRGVGKVHIIDGRVRHSLMLEVYTTSGVGTQITRSS